MADKPLLEREKCVLWLAAHDGWYRPYELERQEVDGQRIGSEADTRLNDIFGNLPDYGEVKVVINEAEYTVQTRKEGAARRYRAFLSKEKPRNPHYEIREDGNGSRIAVLVP